MKKDAYYFPHFSNARHDRKIQRLRKELGLEGYGIYFMLLETLRDQHDLSFPMKDLDLLADEFGTSEQKVRVTICNYGLFEVDESEIFFSPKMLVFLEPYFKGKEQRRMAVESRWAKNAALLESQDAENQEDNTAVLPSNCDSNTDVIQSKVKEKKVKEKRVKKKKENDSKQSDVFSFDEFWDIYPNKVDKQGCLKKWNNLTEPEKMKIKETIKMFVTHKPFANYSHPHPSTYFNQKRWEDEKGAMQQNTSPSKPLQLWEKDLSQNQFPDQGQYENYLSLRKKYLNGEL